MLKTLAVAMLALAIAVPAWSGPAEDQALWDAAIDHNIEGVQIALKNGAAANAPSRTPRRMTLLGVTAMGTWHGSRDRAADLAKNATAVKLSQGGFSDEEIDKYLAVEISKLLFAAGTKLGRDDRTTLFFPIARGNLELVTLLIDKGASVTGDLDGYTPTELAKKYGQEAVYRLLVSRGGIPVDSNSSAQLALVEAASSGDIERMEKAVKDGGRIDGFDANKQTALIAALRHGIYRLQDAAAIWWLLDHGADPNLKSESNFQDLEGVPLHIFVAMNQTVLKGIQNRPEAKPLAEETFARLLKAGAKVSGVDSLGRTPLHIAAKVDNLQAAEILIKEGAKVMPRDKTGKTPLDYAESSPMIQLLKRNGATER